MRYVRLGGSGLRVSRIALGMMSYGDPAWRPWTLGYDDTERFVRQAADLGITFFDTADVYSVGVSEEVTGKALKAVFPRREDYVLATKVHHPMGEAPNDRGLSRGHILDSIDASLRRLGVDHVDLYQIHRWDAETPIEETMEALNDVVRAGKARYLGASSMWAWQFAKAQFTADLGGWTRFVSMQNLYNLLYREEEREQLPQCRDMGVGVIPWSPLARGRLTRPVADATATTRGGMDHMAGTMAHDAGPAIVSAVQEVARERSVPMANVALAWVLAQPGITAPIVGATKPDHLVDAVAALDLELTEEERKRLEAPYRQRPTLAFA